MVIELHERSPIQSAVIIGMITKSDDLAAGVRVICLSRVWLRTELDDTKSYYQLIIKSAISERQKRRKLFNVALKLNYNFECDWLIS